MPNAFDLGDALPQIKANQSFVATSSVIGALVALLIFMLDRRFGSFLREEGYLWYGVQRVFLGEIPIRDFMSYETGRYYLSAGVLGLFHDHGLLALHARLALWATFGLSLAVSLVAKAWNERQLAVAGHVRRVARHLDGAASQDL